MCTAKEILVDYVFNNSLRICLVVAQKVEKDLKSGNYQIRLCSKRSTVVYRTIQYFYMLRCHLKITIYRGDPMGVVMAVDVTQALFSTEYAIAELTRHDS